MAGGRHDARLKWTISVSFFHLFCSVFSPFFEMQRLRTKFEVFCSCLQSPFHFYIHETALKQFQHHTSYDPWSNLLRWLQCKEFENCCAVFKVNSDIVRCSAQNKFPMSFCVALSQLSPSIFHRSSWYGVTTFLALFHQQHNRTPHPAFSKALKI